MRDDNVGTGLGAVITTIIILIFLPTSLPAADWLTYTKETSARLVADPALGANDTQEKDFAVGDVDQDGDLDLICVRKEPWMASGRRRNVLFLNEGIAEGHAQNGVLVDRTQLYVTAADDGGQGFLDLTADRDVQLVDVDGDGWLDMVTATTFGAGLPKTISHPRVYRNLGAPAGTWLGFRYEQARTPQMPSSPNFCGTAFQDVTGDGAPDLYFVEYETTLEDRLWINDGAGSFTDESVPRMTFEMRESEFGVFAVAADVNHDGFNDIIKCRSNGAPYRISIAYNDPQNAGVFSDFEAVYVAAPYYVELGDLNDDGLIDIVVNDDDIDRYLLNQGNGADGLANFATYSLPPASDGFAGRTILADLNNDGFLDVLQADATVNGFGCDRHLVTWRNLANPPVVTFTEETGGIPLNDRKGTWDVGTIDLNEDGWLDLIIGRCSGIDVWIAVPPAQINFSYPQGRPPFIAPLEPFSLEVALEIIGMATVIPGEVKVHVSVNGGPYQSSVMTGQGGNVYTGTLPASNCLDHLDYYVSAATVEGDVFRDPADAPLNTYSTVAAAGAGVIFEDRFEGDVSGWTITSSSLIAGEWEQADPNGTIWNGSLAAPDSDAGPPPEVMAFVTENGPPGAEAGDHDLDGGPTRLLSPPIDLTGSDAYVSYDLWLFTDLGVPDGLLVEVSSDDGQSWQTVESVATTESEWRSGSFLVSDHVAPSPQVRVRFSVADSPNDSITEAGVDNFRVDALFCDSFVRGDANDDGSFNVGDPVFLLEFLFGPIGNLPCRDGGDVNDDEVLDIADAVYMLGALFGGGTPPAAPYPDCGLDPSGDVLDCVEYAHCP